jgi:lipoyl(octanoyl) transferase
MVSLIETAIMDLLKLYDIESQLKDGAPGVYVQGAKIAALGLKVKNGATYHGLSSPILSRFKSIKQYTSNCPGP